MGTVVPTWHLHLALSRKISRTCLGSIRRLLRNKKNRTGVFSRYNWFQLVDIVRGGLVWCCASSDLLIIDRQYLVNIAFLSKNCFYTLTKKNGPIIHVLNMRVLLTIPLRAYKVALITVKVTAYIRAQKNSSNVVCIVIMYFYVCEN